MHHIISRSNLGPRLSAFLVVLGLLIACAPVPAVTRATVKPVAARIAMSAEPSVSLVPVGTCDVVRRKIGSGIIRYQLSWTSSAGGAVSGHPFSVVYGHVIGAQFVPGTAGSQPTDLYDATLIDSNSVDLAIGVGANLSNATAFYWRATVPIFQDGESTLDLVIANAGSAKSGTVVLHIQTPPLPDVLLLPLGGLK